MDKATNLANTSSNDPDDVYHTNGSAYYVVMSTEGNRTHILRVGSKGLDIDGLDLIVVRPDDLAAAVHRSDRLLPSNLDQGCAFIVPQRHTASALAVMNPAAVAGDDDQWEGLGQVLLMPDMTFAG